MAASTREIYSLHESSSGAHPSSALGQISFALPFSFSLIFLTLEYWNIGTLERPLQPFRGFCIDLGKSNKQTFVILLILQSAVTKRRSLCGEADETDGEIALHEASSTTFIAHVLVPLPAPVLCRPALRIIISIHVFYGHV